MFTILDGKTLRKIYEFEEDTYEYEDCEVDIQKDRIVNELSIESIEIEKTSTIISTIQTICI